MDETKTGSSGAANANSIPDGNPSHERIAALAKSSIPTPIVDYSTAPEPTIEYRRSAVSRDLRANVWMMTFGRCYYCGNMTNPWFTFTVDHVYPVYRGGSNDIRNLVPCCKFCNSSKGSKLLDEWNPGRPLWFLSDDYRDNYRISHLATIEEWRLDLISDEEWESGGDL